jgi:hypothetical protein
MHAHTKRSLSVFLALALILSATGCADAYTESMRMSAKVSDGVSEGIKLVGQLFDQNSISREEKNGIAGYLADITNGNTKFRTTVATIHSQNAQAGKAQYIAAADVFLQLAGDPTTLSVLHVKDANAQAKVTLWANTFKVTLDGISAAISSAKGK